MSERLNYNHIAPAGAKALSGVYGYVMQSGLPATLVNLAYLRVSQINNCAYCLDMHTRDLLKGGVKIEKLALVQAWAEAAWVNTASPAIRTAPREILSLDIFRAFPMRRRAAAYAPSVRDRTGS